MSTNVIEQNAEKRAYAKIDGSYEQYLAWCEKFETKPRKFERWLRGQMHWVVQEKDARAYRAAAERLRWIVAR